MASKCVGGRAAHELLGKRFTSDFTVVRLGASPTGDGDHPERPVTVAMGGHRFELPLGELKALVATGFVVEA